MNNQKQYVLTMLLYANDNRGEFPKKGGDLHVSWVDPDVFEYLTETADLSLGTLACPNKSDWFRYQSWRIRVGYYSLYGRDTDHPKMPQEPPQEAGGRWPWEVRWPWDSPQRVTDEPMLEMVADIIEVDTDIPPITSAPHGPYGDVRGAPVQTPLKINSQGGNVGRLDGSVIWRNQEEMKPRPVKAPSHKTRTGYW